VVGASGRHDRQTLAAGTPRGCCSLTSIMSNSVAAGPARPRSGCGVLPTPAKGGKEAFVERM